MSFDSPNPPGQFPQVRMRRLRRSDWMRRLVREHQLTANDLIWPIFLQDGTSTSTRPASSG
ncbi:MAG: hypothetical protein SH850_10045 [Planctomycetaceae bacterium]|nr:hypothetical protein [Planctomycetaceae bacterium]